MDEVLVGSGDARLRFALEDTHPRPPYLGVKLTVAGLTAELSVYESYMSSGFDDLAEFFVGLARDWRGWSGNRSWSSLESDLHLEARHDRIGHVILTVELRHLPHWRATGEVLIDAGEDLSATAAELVALASAYRNERAGS